MASLDIVEVVVCTECLLKTALYRSTKPRQLVAVMRFCEIRPVLSICISGVSRKIHVMRNLPLMCQAEP